ncbi:MAG: CDP-alcohol phosphatidyltransferase family protein [Thioalkalivibrio sp.]|nr:CDP-alcohol phosphatidyltransferase family protein [Thioalkalivibrio sp.]
MKIRLRNQGLWQQTRQFAAQARVWRTELTVGLLTVLTGATLLHLAAGVPASVFAASLLTYGLLVCMVLHTSPAAFHRDGPGLANRVTFLRAALVMPVAAMALLPAHLDANATYWLLGLAAIALALDGLDGAVARRTGRVTTFGARFDMELDALLILVLALLVWQTGQTGIWVLLIGLMRYLFVASGWRWTWLQGELPPSRRRQTVCVVQSVALLVALAPLIAPDFAGAMALGALILLSYSFIVDGLWLYRQGRSLAGECR